ncbi:MAG: hypothetical protein M1827_001984 [Pycnora praestabilis]|nr:MAG: hypothetical protein M1827_001984 [Pycnora praestabilis]
MHGVPIGILRWKKMLLINHTGGYSELFSVPPPGTGNNEDLAMPIRINIKCVKRLDNEEPFLLARYSVQKRLIWNKREKFSRAERLRQKAASREWLKAGEEERLARLNGIKPLPGFRKLPLELRQVIFDYTYETEKARPFKYKANYGLPDPGTQFFFDTLLGPKPKSLLLANRQIYDEAVYVLYAKPVFWFSRTIDLETFITSISPSKLKHVRRIELNFDPSYFLEVFNAEIIYQTYTHINIEGNHAPKYDNPPYLTSQGYAGVTTTALGIGMAVICKWIAKAALTFVSHVKDIRIVGGSLSETKRAVLMASLNTIEGVSYADLSDGSRRKSVTEASDVGLYD